MIDKKILNMAIKKYGADTQQDMVIEEALELALAILKHRRAVKEGYPATILSRRTNVVEESADTRVMLEQVDMMFDCEEEVKQQIEYKVNRLKERLENENFSCM